MKYNWNVYKVFKNGKRAKAPINEFEATEEEYLEYFKEHLRENFSGGFELVRADLPQERVAEVVDAAEEKFSKEKNRVLGDLVAAAGVEDGKPLMAGLVFYAESGWKWQWAALQSGTSKYIAGLSPGFKTHGEAYEWIQDLISSNR